MPHLFLQDIAWWCIPLISAAMEAMFTFASHVLNARKVVHKMCKHSHNSASFELQIHFGNLCESASSEIARDMS